MSLTKDQLQNISEEVKKNEPSVKTEITFDDFDLAVSSQNDNQNSEENKVVDYRTFFDDAGNFENDVYSVIKEEPVQADKYEHQDSVFNLNDHFPSNKTKTIQSDISNILENPNLIQNQIDFIKSEIKNDNDLFDLLLKESLYIQELKQFIFNNEYLVDNIKKNDIAVVESLLKSGINPNNIVNDNVALSVAVRFSGKEMVQLLCDYGANPNQTNKYNETALFTAVKVNKNEIYNYLIENGADKNIINSFGKSVTDLLLDNKVSETVSTQKSNHYQSNSKHDTVRFFKDKYSALKDLKELFDTGIISSEEYSIERKKLIKL